MKTKSLTAAQIDTLAQHLSEVLGPNAANPARLLVARIGEERAAITFTSIMSAHTFDQAEARLILVLKYGNNDPATEPTPAATIALVIGKRQAILDQAQTGALPQPPDFSKPTHARFRAKLEQIVALAEAGGIAALQSFEINPASSSPKAMARYRDLCMIAITARAGASMKITREFCPGKRHIYDFGLRSHENGWAQIDTAQDASYFGTRANPTRLMIFSYCEGDTTLKEAASPEEFAAELREIDAWNRE